ncbi:MAG TPA: hypothetical protein VMA37_16760 [Acetobacteraceae bacterium]|nr:hypothetical protein [Acetobacteraceae bacterium]
MEPCAPAGTARSSSGTFFAGQILAPLRDDSGNFDGFVLETACGKERCFETRDPTIAALVQRAWLEHLRVSVLVAPECCRHPLSVILGTPSPGSGIPDIGISNLGILGATS